ncbi:von Willebrand factor A-like protein [Gracilaria domingensis]|nr:von Willebrand factor A-like protein [Gracilaria domingensis]
MVFRFFTFAALAAITTLCVQATPAPPQCEINNVCYIIDQSGSINDSEYEREQNFVIAISNEIETTSATDPLNSAVAFSDAAQTIQNLVADLNVFQTAVRAPRLFRGGTVISNGLNECKNILQSAQGDHNAIVLITDGQTRSSDVPESEQAADAAKAAGIEIVTVGIGNDVSQDFLLRIASRSQLYINANFDDLNQRIPQVSQAICGFIDDPSCLIAFEECQFTFSGETSLATFDIPAEQPDTAFTTGVVPKDVTYALGTLNMNGIVPEFIDEAGNASPITDFGSQRFTPTHFKPYWVAQDRGSGIGHQTFQGDQAQVAQNRCVRVYFTHFQEIREHRVVNRNGVPRSENKCVVFRTV